VIRSGGEASQNNLWLEPVDAGVANLLAVLRRCQGQPDVYREQAPQVLETLAWRARIASMGTACRLAGIGLPAQRLEALARQAAPETDSERAVAGYRDVLARIHAGEVGLPLTPDGISALHAGLYAYLPGEGGAWQWRDTVGQERLAGRRETVRPASVQADEVPGAMAESCDRLATAWENEAVERLLVVNGFVLDFLCIQPVPAGNERLARLVTLLLLRAAGHPVGQYVSLAGIVEQTRQGYEEALQRSSAGWATGQHDLTAWHQYRLGVLVYAYRAFEKQANALDTDPGAGGREVWLAIEKFRPGQRFAISDLEQMCPDADRATIRRALGELREQGRVTCLGTGRAAEWQRT